MSGAVGLLRPKVRWKLLRANHETVSKTAAATSHHPVTPQDVDRSKLGNEQVDGTAPRT